MHRFLLLKIASPGEDPFPGILCSSQKHRIAKRNSDGRPMHSLIIFSQSACLHQKKKIIQHLRDRNETSSTARCDRSSVRKQDRPFNWHHMSGFHWTPCKVPGCVPVSGENDPLHIAFFAVKTKSDKWQSARWTSSYKKHDLQFSRYKNSCSIGWYSKLPSTVFPPQQRSDFRRSIFSFKSWLKRFILCFVKKNHMCATFLYIFL